MFKHTDLPPSALFLLFFSAHFLLTPIDCASDVSAVSVNMKQIQAIESYLDLNENPCENYYAYACGNWAHQHSSEHYTEATSLIDHKVNKRLIDYFQNYQLQSDANSGNQTYTDKIWLYYRACKHVKERQLQRYLELVRPSAHLDWQLMHQLRAPNTTWPAGHFNWLFTLAKLRRYSFGDTLISHVISPKSANASVYVLDLDKPTKEEENKLPSMETIAVILLRVGVPKLRAIVVAKQLHEFERQLQKLHDIDDEHGLLEITLRDLQADMPQMPWRLYVQLVLGHEVGLDYELQISNWNYFLALGEFLKHTKDSLICNYVMFKFLSFLVRDGASSFSKVDCMWDVRTKMDVAVNFLYKQQFYGGDSAAKYEADIERILTSAKREFAAKLDANAMQLRPAQLQYLKRKLGAMRFNIGNLPSTVDEHFVNAYYAGVHISHKDYYKNHLQLLQLNARKEHAQLTTPPASAADYFYIGDSDSARSCTPFYLFRRNLIVIPYAILQPPMFHINMHDILKMGLLGFVLTHEIIHGLSYDYAGNEQEIGERITRNAQFESSLKCLQQIETESVDERIANIVGLRVAFDALFGANATMNARQPSFSAIPAKRLFFLSFAQFFCGNLLSEFTDHDADNVRLQQTLLNFEPFAEEYQCTLGDAMNPERKCKLY
ncbi:neprilysin-4 [Anastrepha ludens]|uniref:neprilysin-4 n=1 Tax=Anastrepha ludens TaxID=28586 RepID=UPI0023B138D5|nr:neprilysin-4 [Anastrepha ludens]